MSAADRVAQANRRVEWRPARGVEQQREEDSAQSLHHPRDRAIPSLLCAYRWSLRARSITERNVDRRKCGGQVSSIPAGNLLERPGLSLIHISEPTRQAEISYAVFCLKKK